MTNEEKNICNIAIDMLSKQFRRDRFGIEERSENYTSLIFCSNDFLRVKFTERSKWISIRLAKEDMDVNDPRFAAQKNKNQFHWKASIEKEGDIRMFEKELINACNLMGDTGDYVPRKTNHSRIELGINLREILDKISKKQG